MKTHRPIPRRRRSRPMADLFKTRRRGPGRLIFILGVAVITGAGYILLFSAALGVKQVTVEGAPDRLVDPIRESASEAADTRYGPLVSRSLLLVTEGTVGGQIKREQPDVAKVEVKKKWPSTLVVKVEERQTQFGWKSNGQTYLIDTAGTAFAKTPTDMPGLVTVEDAANVPVELGKPVAGASFVKFVQDATAKLKEAGIVVTGFQVTDTTFEVRALTDQRYYVLFDTTRPVTNQTDALTLALKTQKPREYADVRVAGRVYVK